MEKQRTLTGSQSASPYLASGAGMRMVSHPHDHHGSSRAKSLPVLFLWNIANYRSVQCELWKTWKTWPMLSYPHSSFCVIAMDWVPVGPRIMMAQDQSSNWEIRVEGTHRSINVRTGLQLAALHALPGTRRPKVVLYLWQQPSKHLTASAATARSCLLYQAASSMTRSLSYFTWNSPMLSWLKLLLWFLLEQNFNSYSRIYTDKLLASNTSLRCSS